MVSRITKRTPTKSIKSHCLRHSRTPVKRDVAAVLSSFHKTCRRRLAKLFSKLARISTTPTKSRRKHGYQLVQKDPNFPKDSDSSSPIKSLQFENPTKLPPQTSPRKPTVVLDLDETLVHATVDPPTRRFDFVVRPRIGGEIVTFYVLKRPGLSEFLEKLAAEYEVVVFTAGLKEYASLVVDLIDPRGLISHRLYRDACKEMEGRFVKDLGELGRELRKVVLVDDNPNASLLQPENAIRVRPFVDDLGDRELGRVGRVLEGLGGAEDLRVAARRLWEEEEEEADGAVMVSIEL
uniref:FCP1 homology domain-containing protein n=1 Tax=Kalanchoe fedtschenkoi TaxID=63787 RepID=A0A7N0RES8_KALFE